MVIVKTELSIEEVKTFEVSTIISCAIDAPEKPPCGGSCYLDQLVSLARSLVSQFWALTTYPPATPISIGTTLVMNMSKIELKKSIIRFS